MTSKDLLTLDNLFRLVGGMFLAGLLAFNSWIAVGIVFLVWGYLHESAQHRKDGRWIGWVTPKRLTEVTMWGVGGCVGYFLVS